VQEPDPDVLRAWEALLVAHRRATVLLDAELRARSGLDLDDYDVLLQLRRAGGRARMSDVAAAVLISRASTTRVVDRLVARGLVERLDHPGDRRVVVVGLTPTGRRVQARAARVHLDGIARVVGGALAAGGVRSRAELRALADALEALAGATPDAPPA
jgi:DNA-binding MarR family transcriptional regulator